MRTVQLERDLHDVGLEGRGALFQTRSSLIRGRGGGDESIVQADGTAELIGLLFAPRPLFTPVRKWFGHQADLSVGTNQANQKAVRRVVRNTETKSTDHWMGVTGASGDGENFFTVCVLVCSESRTACCYAGRREESGC